MGQGAGVAEGEGDDVKCQLCDGDFLPKELFDLKDAVPGGAKVTCYQCGIKLDGEEIKRLTAALHAVRRHPDYRYLNVPADGFLKLCSPGGLTTASGQTALDPDGWERCPEAEKTMPLGDECWRRKVTV